MIIVLLSIAYFQASCFTLQKMSLNDDVCTPLGLRTIGAAKNDQCKHLTKCRVPKTGGKGPTVTQFYNFYRFKATSEKSTKGRALATTKTRWFMFLFRILFHVIKHLVKKYAKKLARKLMKRVVNKARSKLQKGGRFNRKQLFNLAKKQLVKRFPDAAKKAKKLFAKKVKKEMKKKK